MDVEDFLGTLCYSVVPKECFLVISLLSIKYFERSITEHFRKQTSSQFQFRANHDLPVVDKDPQWKSTFAEAPPSFRGAREASSHRQY